MIKKISDWYDTLEEPYRFTTFVYFVFGSGLPFTIAALLHKASYEAWVIFAALGVVHLIVFYILAFYRATRK